MECLGAGDTLIETLLIYPTGFVPKPPWILFLQDMVLTSEPDIWSPQQSDPNLPLQL